MTEQQIKEEVLRYLKDDAYNYAILIDGEWGSGKTFFVKHELSDAINEQEVNTKNRAIKYISLYGCKNIEDVQENIAWSFAENARKKLNEKVEIGETATKVTENILLSGRKIGNAILKKFVPDLSTYSITSDWLNMASFIFIFDDLERCNCPINEVFGFLNELVEHENTKVILVANEKEITGIAEPTNLEQQYRLALEEKIEWPKVEQRGFYNSYNYKKSTISLDELERRRALLFPTQDANGEYKKIREKLIGVTLTYTPDVLQIMSAIISSSKYDDGFKALLRDKCTSFKSTMDYYRHHNLRSFQFFISKVNYLLERLDDIEIEEAFIEKIQDHIISETFSQAVRLKSNYQPPRDNRTWLRTEQDTKSLVIKQYVENGEFLFETFKQDILIIQQELRASIPNDDPYYLVYQQYYFHTQSWCEEQLSYMQDRLNNNQYPVSFYAKMIIAVQRLVDMGFDNNYLVQLKDSMLRNISDMGEISPIDEDLWFCDDKEFANRVHEIVLEVNEAIANHSTKAGRESVSDILEQSDWVERLEKYVNPNDSRYVNDIAIFSKADVSKWVAKIHDADPKEIDDFRQWLSSVYPRDVIRKKYIEDEKSIKEIKDKIGKLEERDLIKKASLGWLDYQFNQIIQINESIRPNNSSQSGNGGTSNSKIEQEKTNEALNGPQTGDVN